MSNFKLSVKAKSDFQKIAHYTQKQWGKNKRNQYIKQIDLCFHQLAQNPAIGLDCNFIKKDYIKFPQGSHMIYYRKTPNNKILIIRILHKSMDVNLHL